MLTGSEDRKIVLSDAANDMKPIFVHQGHTMAITDAHFHPNIPNLIGSTAEDNSLQFWWPSEEAFKNVNLQTGEEAQDKREVKNE